MPRLSDHDLSNLGVYHVATRLVLGGEEAPPFTAVTEKLPARNPWTRQGNPQGSQDQRASDRCRRRQHGKPVLPVHCGPAPSGLVRRFRSPATHAGHLSRMSRPVRRSCAISAFRPLLPKEW
jgi:hypothetical protein